MQRTRANMVPVTKIYLLYLQTVLIIASRARRHNIESMFTASVISFKSKYLES